MSHFPVSQQRAVTEVVMQQRSSSLTVNCSNSLSLRCSSLLNSCRSEPQCLNQHPEHFPVAVSSLRAVSLHVQPSAGTLKRLYIFSGLPRTSTGSCLKSLGCRTAGARLVQVFWLSVNCSGASPVPLFSNHPELLVRNCSYFRCPQPTRLQPRSLFYYCRQDKHHKGSVLPDLCSIIANFMFFLMCIF